MFDLILQNVSQHIDLTPKEAKFFTSLLKPLVIGKKQFLLRSGEISKHENFIIEGVMRSYTIDNEGNEHIAMFGMEGWWIGDMYSFLSAKPSLQNIDALEDTKLLQISKDDLDLLYDKVPKFDRFFRILLQNAFVANQNRILASISQTAEEQYLAFVKKYPTLEQRVPQHQVASYLGITPETISRIRKKR
jgi:CRP-like cAMP-binding protein